MHYSFFIALLASSFLMSSLEANPPFDDSKKVSRSSRPRLNNNNNNRGISIATEPVNPFHSTHLFGLEALKKLDDLKSRQKKKWEEENAQCVREALREKLNSNLAKAKEIFLNEVVQRSCPISMIQLGHIAEEHNDLEKAFSWYVGSLCTRAFQGKPIADINTAWESLRRIVGKLPQLNGNPHPAQLFYDKLRQENDCIARISASPSIKISLRVQKFISTLINAHLHYCLDEDLSAYIVGLARWVSNGIPSDHLEYLGDCFFGNNVMAKAGYCYYLSKTLNSQRSLAHILLGGNDINYDQEGKLFEEKDRYNVAGRILWKFLRYGKDEETKKNAAGVLASYIYKGKITLDETGCLLPKNQKFNIVANLYRQAKTPFALTKLAFLIEEGKITKGLHGEEISEESKYEAAAALYRQDKTLEAFANLANLIKKGKITKGLYGEEIPEENKYEAAAALYRQANIPTAWNNLAMLIQKGKITKSLRGEEISEENKYEAAADLCRKANTPHAWSNLAVLIIEGKITKGLHGEELSEENKYEAAADLCRKANTPNAWSNLAVLIIEGKITKGLHGGDISEENKYEAAADLCRKASIPSALNNLAVLIGEGKITKGLHGEELSEENKYEAAIKEVEALETPAGLVNHALLLLCTQKEVARKKALDLLLQASLQGDLRAREYYETLSTAGQEEVLIILEENLNDDEKNDTSSPNEAEKAEKDKLLTPLSLTPLNDQHIVQEAEEAPSDVQTDPLNTDEKGSETDELPITPPPALISHELIIQAQTEHMPIEPQAYPLSTEAKQALKVLKKEQKKKQRKQYFKKLIQGKFLLQEERNSLMRKSKLANSMTDHTCKIKVELVKDTQSQLKSLLKSEVKNVWKLIDDIKAGGRLGHPEQLSNAKTPEGKSMFSRHITDKHRLVYTLSKNVLTIYSCAGHYDD